MPNPLRNNLDYDRIHSHDHSLSPGAEDEESEFIEIDINSSSFGTNLAVGPGQRITGFPFHCPCWELFRKAQGTRNASVGEIQAFFDLLRSFPRHELVDFGHTYGGIATYDLELNYFHLTYSIPPLKHLLPGEEPRLVYVRDDEAVQELQKHNPLEIKEIQLAFETDGNVCRLPSEVESDKPEPSIIAGTGVTDPFQRVPVEILQLILGELYSQDVVSVKQSSRPFQYTPLADTFWRSRFEPGREFGHIFEAQDYFRCRNGQWKTIYHKIKSVKRTPALVNRERIWTLAEVLSGLLRTKLDLSQCFGTPLRSYFEPAAQQLEEDGSCQKASRCLRAFNKDFDTGSRTLFARAIAVPQETSSIFVSTVELLGKTYICGLRLQHSEGPAFRLGYIRPEAETLCTWGTRTRPRGFVGFQLAQGQRGIHGLAILSSQDGLSDWVGEHYHVPKRRLMLVSHQTHATKSIAMIEGGFDVSYHLANPLITRRSNMIVDLHIGYQDGVARHSFR